MREEQRREERRGEERRGEACSRAACCRAACCRAACCREACCGKAELHGTVCQGRLRAKTRRRWLCPGHAGYGRHAARPCCPLWVSWDIRLLCDASVMLQLVQ